MTTTSSGTYSASLFDAVRQSTAELVAHRAASVNSNCSVSIDHACIENELTQHPTLYRTDAAPSNWASWYHYADHTQPDNIVQYCFVLDALNFCFWPLPRYEYAQFASALKRTYQRDPDAFTADRLIQVTESELQQWLQPLSPAEEQEMMRLAHFPIPADYSSQVLAHDDAQHGFSIPMLASRCRALNELGVELKRSFQGQACNVVEAAQHSGAQLAALLTAHFPAFRDHAIDPLTGRQCFFYKRGQILVADLFGAFQGQSQGQFDDIAEITCFADYRLPQLLQHLGILRYSDELKRRIAAQELVPAGSEAELSIRAHTVQAVEFMRSKMKSLYNHDILSIQMDWILWERGESMLDALPPHHRTMTCYY